MGLLGTYGFDNLITSVEEWKKLENSPIHFISQMLLNIDTLINRAINPVVAAYQHQSD